MTYNWDRELARLKRKSQWRSFLISTFNWTLFVIVPTAGTLYWIWYMVHR